MWKRIPNHSEYDINEDGVVRSWKSAKPRVLSPFITAKYPSVVLHTGGKKTTCYIHRLVWEAFKGPIPEGMLVLHGPGGDKSNCKLSYLRLGTVKENMRDKVADGTHQQGEAITSAKLSEEQVIYIRQRAADGMKRITLARLFDVGGSTITKIVLKQRWKHVG